MVRTPAERGAQPGERVRCLCVVARAAGVVQRTLERLPLLSELTTGVVAVGDRGPRLCKAEVVAGRLEHRYRFIRGRKHRLPVRLGVVLRSIEAHEYLHPPVTPKLARDPLSLRENRLDLVELAGEEEHGTQAQEAFRALGGIFGCQVGDSLKEVPGGGHVASLLSPTRSRIKPFRGAHTERTHAVIDRTDLGLVAIRLLQVVADDLLDLRQPVANLLFEPARVAFVELRPQPLDERAVGGIAYEGMAEAKGCLVHEASLCGERGELLLLERPQPLGRDSDVRVEQRRNRAAVERLAFHRTTFQGFPLRRRQAIEACRQQCAQARRNGCRVTRLPQQRRGFVHEQRIAARAGNKIRIGIGVEQRAHQIFGVACGEGLEAHDTRPCGPRFEQLGRAVASTKTGTWSVRRAGRSSGVRSAQCRSSTPRTSGRSAASTATRWRSAQATSSGATDPPSPISAVIRAATDLSTSRPTFARASSSAESRRGSRQPGGRSRRPARR